MGSVHVRLDRVECGTACRLPLTLTSFSKPRCVVVCLFRRITMGVKLGVLLAGRTPRSSGCLPLRDSGLTLCLWRSAAQQLLCNPWLHGCFCFCLFFFTLHLHGGHDDDSNRHQAEKTDLQSSTSPVHGVSQNSAVALRGTISRLPPIRDGSRRDGKRKRNHPDRVPLTLKRMG